VQAHRGFESHPIRQHRDASLPAQQGQPQQASAASQQAAIAAQQPAMAFATPPGSAAKAPVGTSSNAPAISALVMMISVQEG
jgi:hypothetical protein